MAISTYKNCAKPCAAPVLFRSTEHNTFVNLAQEITLGITRKNVGQSTRWFESCRSTPPSPSGCRGRLLMSFSLMLSISLIHHLANTSKLTQPTYISCGHARTKNSRTSRVAAAISRKTWLHRPPFHQEPRAILLGGIQWPPWQVSCSLRVGFLEYFELHWTDFKI